MSDGRTQKQSNKKAWFSKCVQLSASLVKNQLSHKYVLDKCRCICPCCNNEWYANCLSQKPKILHRKFKFSGQLVCCLYNQTNYGQTLNSFWNLTLEGLGSGIVLRVPMFEYCHYFASNTYYVCNFLLTDKTDGRT